MVVLAIDTLDHLAIMSEGNRWAWTAICLHTSYMFMIPIKDKSTENSVQAYLSGKLANKGRSVVILSDKGTESKSRVQNEACDQLGIKRLFYNQFHYKEM